MLKSKQLRLSIHSIDGVVYDFYQIYNGFNEAGSAWQCNNFMSLSVELPPVLQTE